jgi:ABC-2 type transport system permease protein
MSVAVQTGEAIGPGRARLRPGSFLWLVSYDLTMSWRRVRGMFGSLQTSAVVLIVFGALLSFHLVAWPVARWFAQEPGANGPSRMFYPALASAMLFVLPWLISQSLTSMTRALYTRGDLDLLFASPLPSGRILAARALAVAVESISSVAIFLLPIANMNVLLNGWSWLSVYPALLGSGLFATSIGIMLTLGLFKIAGPRRTRIFSQILATVVGAAFVIMLQAIHVLPVQIRESIVAAIESPDSGWLFDRHGVVWLPVRAAAGELGDLILWCLVSTLVFSATVVMLGRIFAANAMQSANAPVTAAPPRKRKSRMRFKSGAGRALRWKEWRLLSRDPWLISQILLQVVYTLPISIVIWRSQGPDGSIALSVAPAIVVIASQISASLAWLTISSEDAPEFLSSAPVTPAHVKRRKLEAIALPLVCFLALPLAMLAWFSLHAALFAVVFATGASLSTALLNLWHPMPARRVMMLRRHSQSKIIGMIEHLLSLLWAVAMVMAVLGTWLAAMPLSIIAGIVWFSRPRRQRRAKLPKSAVPVAAA